LRIAKITLKFAEAVISAWTSWKKWSYQIFQFCDYTVGVYQLWSIC